MFDMTAFLGGARQGEQVALAAARRAVDVFARMLVDNAREYAPVETGALMSSGTAQPAEVKGSGVKATVGFNTDYAAARHERQPEADAPPTVNPKGQWKYLERAMREMTPRFGPFVAGQIRAATGG